MNIKVVAQSTYRELCIKTLNITLSGVLTLAIYSLSGCALKPSETASSLAESDSRHAEDFFVVDCLLPGEVRQLGQNFTFMAPRRAIKTDGFDCGIRGGEFTAYDRANYKTALKVWLPQAHEGKAEAQAYVGEIYERGLGVEPDYDLALTWYKKAAEQGNSRAQVNLGYLYEKGLGVERSIPTALNMYRKSSGLTGDDLAFASSIELETQKRIGVVQKEVDSLKQDLSESQQEAQLLRKHLARSGSQIQASRNKLNRTLAALNLTQEQLETAKNAPAGQYSQQALIQYQQQLQLDQSQANNQQKQLKQLEQAYTKENKTLTARLEAAEQRVGSYQQEIEENRQSSKALRTKLAENEAELEELKKDYEEKQSFETTTESEHQQKISALTTQLDERESNLERQNQNTNGLVRKMELLVVKNKQLESQLQKGAVKDTGMQQLAQKLELATQNMRSQQQKIDRLNAETSELKKERQRLESSQNLTVAQQRSQVEKLSAQLKQREERLENLQANAGEAVQKMEKLAQENQSLEEKFSNRGSVNDTALKSVAQQLAQAARELRVQHQQVAQLEGEKNKLAADNKKLVAIQTNSLAQRDEELRQLQNEINKQQRKRRKLQRKLSEAKNQNAMQVASNEPPAIELIDPPLSVTRGVLTYKLRSPVSIREITGSAKAPAGLMTFSVNDHIEQIDDAGLFKSKINLGGKRTPVNITLIDRKGSKADLNFVILSMGGNSKLTPVADTDRSRLIQLAENIDFGGYHALLIGNEKYSHMPSLDTPIDDVREIDKLLREKYNFKTTVLTNANRYSILSALNKLRKKLTEKDNLLIYYAGHGELDEVNKEGQWLPIDAEPESTANWISTDAITDIINTMSVKHVLVVADSCYSGAMTRTSLARLESGMSPDLKHKWLEMMAQAKSRTVFTSGGLKPVLDSGSDGHSIFAKAFVDALKKNSDILEGQALYRKVYSEVQNAADRVGFDQAPQYAPIRHTGHESGDFFFVPKEA
ncbi:MAG: hypothetical protein V3V31_01195 [Methylococcales bacterium]